MPTYGYTGFFLGESSKNIQTGLTDGGSIDRNFLVINVVDVFEKYADKEIEIWYQANRIDLYMHGR